MNKSIAKNNKVLFLFSRNMLDEIPRIKSKAIPSEILYGAMELIEMGWHVDIYDVGNNGLFGRLNRTVKRYGFNLIGYSTIMRIMDFDIIIIKDDFSLMSTLICRLLGKKIIYKDAMFNIPRRFWKRWSAYINLRLASTVVAYSEYQARMWEKEFKLPGNHIKTMHYCIDTDFYPILGINDANENYIISIGRDTGRNYDVLSRASKLCNMKVKLITLPYLLSDEIKGNSNIQVLQNVSYDDLFELYKHSTLSIVPLSKDLNYPTGIRGILESLALGIPTIATRTPVLEEYFCDRKDILFVDAESDHALSLAMIELAGNSDLRRELSCNGIKKVRTCYNMSTYIKDFEEIIVNTINL